MSATAQIEWTPTKQAILGPDPGLLLYGEVSVWFHKLHIFREREEERMYRQEPSAEDLEIHKSLVLRLMADGEHLLQLIRQSAGLIQNPEQIKTDTLPAAVESLREPIAAGTSLCPPIAAPTY